MSHLEERDSPVGCIEQIFFFDRVESFGELMVHHLHRGLGQLHDKISSSDKTFIAGVASDVQDVQHNTCVQILREHACVQLI